MDVSATADEAEASALKVSGLEAFGYEYVNQDDGWYECPGPQGPTVDGFGRWVTDPARFPPGPGGENGIAVVAGYVHSLGLKFGIYVTPGISLQAVEDDSPILGTRYRADDIATGKPENNYNCGGMVGIDYRKPGAQAFVDSVVDEFAQWGVDYIKLDGIENKNAPDIRAWSEAIRQSGRPMQLDVTEGSFTVALAGTLDTDATQWEYTSDIECYSCEHGGRSYPLTDYANVRKRFATLALWYPYGGRQFAGYNDFDSVEVGNCADDGLSLPARQTVLSLWSLASSPLIIGANLTTLCPTDLRLLENRAVLGVDQDGISGAPVLRRAGEEVVAKSVRGGSIVGLFNTSGRARVVSTTATALDLPACTKGYVLDNLWTQQATTSGVTITARVPARGVALFQVTSRCP